MVNLISAVGKLIPPYFLEKLECTIREKYQSRLELFEIAKMKLLTLNFLTCARKTCKSSPAAFPLHPKEAELEQVELEMNPLFIKNILPKLDWEAMKTLTQEVCVQMLNTVRYLLTVAAARPTKFTS